MPAVPSCNDSNYCKQGYGDPSPGGMDKTASNHVIYYWHRPNEPVAWHRQPTLPHWFPTGNTLPDLGLPCHGYRPRSCSPNRMVAPACVTQLCLDGFFRKHKTLIHRHFSLTRRCSPGHFSDSVYTAVHEGPSSPGFRQSVDP